MGKLFWCCTAAGVVVAGGVFAGARYACHHPKSALVRGVVLSRSFFPSAGPGQPCEMAPCSEAVPGQTVQAEVQSPSCAPAPIVIQEDDPPAAGSSEELCPSEHADCQRCPNAALCPPAIVEACELQGPTPAGYGDEHGHACPTVMPYCTDEEAAEPAAPHMPYAVEGMEAPKQPGSFWRGLLEGGRQGALAPCQEDAHNYEHYSGCPYIAPSKADRRQQPIPAVAPPKRPGQDECCEEAIPAPKVHKVKYPGGPCRKEDCPRQPGVDTMEYRKSDGGLNEYGPGPS
jgi:hypothetical protein